MGEGEWFFIFWLFKSILIFVNWIFLDFSAFYIILPYYVYYYCILFRYRDWPPGLLSSFFFRAHFTSFHTHTSLLTFLPSSSVTTSYFIFAVVMRECLGNTRACVPHFLYPYWMLLVFSDIASTCKCTMCILSKK